MKLTEINLIPTLSNVSWSQKTMYVNILFYWSDCKVSWLHQDFACTCTWSYSRILRPNSCSIRFIGCSFNSVISYTCTFKPSLLWYECCISHKSKTNPIPQKICKYHTSSYMYDWFLLNIPTRLLRQIYDSYCLIWNLTCIQYCSSLSNVLKILKHDHAYSYIIYHQNI